MDHTKKLQAGIQSFFVVYILVICVSFRSLAPCLEADSLSVLAMRSQKMPHAPACGDQVLLRLIKGEEKMEKNAIGRLGSTDDLVNAIEKVEGILEGVVSANVSSEEFQNILVGYQLILDLLEEREIQEDLKEKNLLESIERKKTEIGSKVRHVETEQLEGKYYEVFEEGNYLSYDPETGILKYGKTTEDKSFKVESKIKRVYMEDAIDDFVKTFVPPIYMDNFDAFGKDEEGNSFRVLWKFEKGEARDWTVPAAMGKVKEETD